MKNDKQEQKKREQNNKQKTINNPPPKKNQTENNEQKKNEEKGIRKEEERNKKRGIRKQKEKQGDSSYSPTHSSASGRQLTHSPIAATSRRGFEVVRRPERFVLPPLVRFGSLGRGSSRVRVGVRFL